jgi:hypothetical protein
MGQEVALIDDLWLLKMDPDQLFCKPFAIA